MDGEWSAFHVPCAVHARTVRTYVHTCFTFNTVLEFYDRLDPIFHILKVIRPHSVSISLNFVE